LGPPWWYNAAGPGGIRESPGALPNVAVNLEPILNTLTIGSVAKPWRSVFIKDKTSNQVYEMEVSGGLFQVTLVP
jgi:hypothetical protein